jgi:hypothetical protein
MKFKLYITILILTVCFQPSDVFAQHWKSIGSAPGIQTASFFWDKYNGIVAYTDAASKITMYKVTSSDKIGYSWTQVSGVYNFEGQVTSIFFRDQSVGWLTVYGVNFGSYYNRGVWTSNDGGNSWAPIIDSEQWNCIYETPQHNLIVSDGGIAFADSLVGIMSAAAAPVKNIHNKTSLTTDGGLTWKRLFSADAVFTESWGIYCQKSSRKFFMLPEAAPGQLDPNRNVFSSSDSGTTWQICGIVPMKSVISASNPGGLYSTGDIGGFGNAIYIQSEVNGLFRSTDEGKTWDSVGGPSLDWDKRFFVPPSCKGGSVIAFDRDGLGWITNDGGDGKIQQDPLFTIKPPINFKAISSCDSAITSFNFIYAGCGYVEYDSSYIENNNPNFSLINQPSYPLKRNEGIRDSLFILFNPHKRVGAFSCKVHLRGKILGEEITRDFDTVFNLNAISNAVPPLLFTNRDSSIFDTLSTCANPVDTVITFTNKGCDTLTITQGPGSLLPEFTLLPPFTLPIKIPPDSSITITFRFKPSATKQFIIRPHFVAEQQGLTQNIDLYLEGNGKSEGGLLSYSPTQFNFQSLSICNHDSASGSISNVGCDSVALDAAKIFGDPDYKLTANSLQPTVLRPNETITYKVYLDPAQKGLRKGFLVLSSKNINDSIPLTVTVTDGTRILSASVNAVDFGIVSVCDRARDTMLTLHNSGCDTLRIDALTGLNLGFASTTKFPIIILPGKDTVIDIFTLLDTAGGKTSSSATLNFESNSDNTISPITLMQTYSKSGRRDVGYYLDATAKSGGDLSSVTYDIKETPNKTFTGAGIKQTQFDLTYNTDLLTYEQSLSSNNLSFDGKHFTIRGSDIAADANGVIAKVGFRVYLTKDSLTTITLASRTDTLNSSCGLLTLSMSGAAEFDYKFLCGERSIQSYLNGVMPMRIISIHPNPAQDEIIVEISGTDFCSGTDSQSVNGDRANGLRVRSTGVSVYDALGAKVYSEIRSLPSGKSTIHLPIHDLAQGVYFVRIGDVGRSFVKMK